MNLQMTNNNNVSLKQRLNEELLIMAVFADPATKAEIDRELDRRSGTAVAGRVERDPVQTPLRRAA